MGEFKKPQRTRTFSSYLEKTGYKGIQIFIFYLLSYIRINLLALIEEQESKQSCLNNQRFLVVIVKDSKIDLN